MICEFCNNTGWTGDNGPGFIGNDEVTPCSCDFGKPKENSITLLGFETVKDIVMLSSLYERVFELEKQNKLLQNEISDLKGHTRIISTEEFHNVLRSIETC